MSVSVVMMVVMCVMLMFVVDMVCCVFVESVIFWCYFVLFVMFFVCIVLWLCCCWCVWWGLICCLLWIIVWNCWLWWSIGVWLWGVRFVKGCLKCIDGDSVRVWMVMWCVLIKGCMGFFWCEVRWCMWWCVWGRWCCCWWLNFCRNCMTCCARISERALWRWCCKSIMWCCISCWMRCWIVGYWWICMWGGWRCWCCCWICIIALRRRWWGIKALSWVIKICLSCFCCCGVWIILSIWVMRFIWILLKLLMWWLMWRVRCCRRRCTGGLKLIFDWAGCWILIWFWVICIWLRSIVFIWVCVCCVLWVIVWCFLFSSTVRACWCRIRFDRRRVSKMLISGNCDILKLICGWRWWIVIIWVWCCYCCIFVCSARSARSKDAWASSSVLSSRLRNLLSWLFWMCVYYCVLLVLILCLCMVMWCLMLWVILCIGLSKSFSRIRRRVYSFRLLCVLMMMMNWWWWWWMFLM